jgi:hypothetical protein
MAPPFRTLEPDGLEKSALDRWRGGRAADSELVAPSGSTAAGNQAVQRQANEAGSDATGIPSAGSCVTIRFDPLRPWLVSASDSSDSSAISAELYGEGAAVPLVHAPVVAFEGLAAHVEDRYLVVPQLLRPQYVQAFSKAMLLRQLQLDAEVKADADEIKRLIREHIGIMRMVPVPPLEERVLVLMRRWAGEPFPYRVSELSEGRRSGRYLDRLFLHLSDAYVDKGLFVDTWTNYYTLILDNFRRADEVRALRDAGSRVFAGDEGVPAPPSFLGILWEDLKSGAVASRIKNYFVGIGQAVKGLIEGIHLLFTDPGKVLEAIGNLPSTLKALWQNRGKLWDQFVNASPDEQARMIGRLFGEIELLIATAGAGGSGKAATSAPALVAAEEVATVGRGGAAAAALTSGGTLTIDLGKLGGEAGRLTSLMAMTAEGSTKGKQAADELATESKAKGGGESKAATESKAGAAEQAAAERVPTAIKTEQDLDRVLGPVRPRLDKPPPALKTPADQRMWELYQRYFSERMESMRADLRTTGRTERNMPLDFDAFNQRYTENPNLVSALRGRLAQGETGNVISDISRGKTAQNLGISKVPEPGVGEVLFPDFVWKGQKGYTAVSNKSRNFFGLGPEDIKRVVNADVDEALGKYYGERYVRRPGLDVTGQRITIDEVILNYDNALVPGDAWADIFAYAKERGGAGIDIGQFTAR